MAQIISTLYNVSENRQVALVNVVDGSRDVIVCEFGKFKRRNDNNSVGKALCVDSFPIVTIIDPGSKYADTDKLIYQCVGIENISKNIARIISSSINHPFSTPEQMVKALEPFLSLLTDGLYAVYFSKMYPTDGSGNYFWTAYTSTHEVRGSADINLSVGRGNTYIPCFLVPTQSSANFKAFELDTCITKLKSGSSLIGLAYHIGGMFCALLAGHHEATACLMEDKDFYCVVVEPLYDFYYEDKEVASTRTPMIEGFNSSSLHIPFSAVSPSLVESTLLARRNYKPDNYSEMQKMYSQGGVKSGISLIPQTIHEKAETSPDFEMMSSAQTISGISIEQLEALLSGQTEYNGSVIVSSNYYNSIVTACNYLQYTNTELFIDFAINIMMNPDLAATHEYVSRRLLSVGDKRIYDMFLDMLKNNTTTLAAVIENADKYVTRFKSEFPGGSHEDQVSDNTDADDFNDVFDDFE